MINQKIPTLPGVIILVIIAVTVFSFVLVYEKNQPNIDRAWSIIKTENADISGVKNFFPGVPQNLNYLDENKYIINLISQWQTCKNEENGITFAFPKDWKVLDKTKSNTVLEHCNSNDIIFSPNISILDPSIEMQYLGNNQTMKEYFETHPDLFESDPIKNGGYFAFDDTQGVQSVLVKDGDVRIRYIFRAKDIFLIRSVNIPDLYLHTFIRGIGFPQFTTSTSTENWTHSCKNQTYGYEVRYPDGMKAFTGGLISSINELNNCSSNSKDFTKKLATVNLAPLDREFMGSLPTGIAITAILNAQKQTFAEKDILKRTLIGGKETVWISKYHGEFYNGSTRYEIDLAKDISDETINAILSTFKILP